MPTVRDVESVLYELAPKELAMEWDNVGLLIGHPEQEVTKVLTALDVTENVADEAVRMGANLIVAHHPVMNCAWNKVQTIRNDTLQGRLFLKLIENNIAAICMHTNLDRAASGVNDVLAARLGLEHVEKLPGGDDILRVGELPGTMALPSFLRWVKAALSPNGIRFVNAGKDVRRVAVGGGACGDFWQAAADFGCDTLVTSDLKYNQFLDARAAGLTVIDAGHFPTEDIVCPVAAEYLRVKFPGLAVEKSAAHREVIQYFV